MNNRVVPSLFSEISEKRLILNTSVKMNCEINSATKLSTSPITELNNETTIIEGVSRGTTNEDKNERVKLLKLGQEEAYNKMPIAIKSKPIDKFSDTEENLHFDLEIIPRIIFESCNIKATKAS
jgi:hypothetical protein